MRNGIKVLALLGTLVGFAVAAPAAQRGASTIDLPARLGVIHFPHQVHQDRVGDCSTCHHKGVEAGACNSCHDIDPRPPKARDAFHKVCRSCHEKQGGPTACNGCHFRN
ncbi:c-type cytochrome [Desulfuromonas versatilis]|uniref:C-type cytochrome n=1 Tax=Desulfuromonas versatilis TaxID=2802975 RepID=A0ABN6E334_9BACT|nr:cytochrome c3 family protein [Desulfuromonas versatilis]BCR06584.1 c-type cytochrome [Desulfuromonas versatilis]